MVSSKNLEFLKEAIAQVQDIEKTAALDKKYYIYHTHHSAQLTNLKYSKPVQSMPELSRPHHKKLIACLDNPRLPEADKERLKEAIKKYHDWIADLEAIERGQADTVERLVEVTNKYKRFIELDLIFDSSDNFIRSRISRL